MRLWRLVYLLEPPVKEIVLALPVAALREGTHIPVVMVVRVVRVVSGEW